MADLNKTIQKSLKGATRIVFLGVGSQLRGDDAAGVLVAQALKKLAKGLSRKIKVIVGETAPENFTGEIKKFKPSHIVIIDTADTGAKPGTLMLIDPKIVGGVSFSTHIMPTKIMVDYLLKSLDCTVIVIGIQPKAMGFGEPVSHRVEHAIEDIISAFKTIIKSL